jgi:hypothetical protein
MAKDDDKKPEADKSAAKEIDPNAGLVKMRKAGQVLYVHPTCVKEHEKAEWEVS